MRDIPLPVHAGVLPPSGGAPFVLLHGSWAGGWCWRQVADLLRSHGHSVFTPTMTGVGERRHQMSYHVTLDTWVDDVVELFEAEEITGAVLVGHSFGGRVVAGVADRLRDRIRRIIFLDCALPASGQSLLDQLGQVAGSEAVAARVAQTRHSHGMSLPPPSAQSLGVLDATQQAWVDRRLTPQPFGTNTSTLHFRTPIGAGLPITFIKFTDPIFPVSEKAHAFADAQSGWHIRSIPTGHMGMVSAAGPLADMLLAVAGQPETISG